jgi:hypothetical protein
MTRVESLRRTVQGFVPRGRPQHAVIASHERGREPFTVLDEVVRELALDAQRPLVGRPVHRGKDAHHLVSARHDVDRAAYAAIRADRARRLGLARDALVAERLQVSERSGGAHLDALSTERARRLPERPVELRRDLRIESAVHDTDRVVALLFGAHAHAPVARDAVLVVPQDERVRVVGLGRSRLPPLETARSGLVPVDQPRHLLRGVPRERVDVDVPVLRGNHLEQHPPVHFQPAALRLHLHPGLGPGGARSDRIPGAFELDDAEAAPAERLEAVVVAERRNLARMTLGHLEEGLARGEGDFLAVEVQRRPCAAVPSVGLAHVRPSLLSCSYRRRDAPPVPENT